jgi:hypothetical protein
MNLLAHLSMIFFFVCLFDSYFVCHKLIFISLNIKYLFALLSYLICLKPTNIFIRQTLMAAKISDIPFAGGELENAGKLIGVLERILVLTFVIVGKIEVIGFLIAAKTILRYKDTDTTKSEYVLIGTMISFGIAMLFVWLFINFSEILKTNWWHDYTPFQIAENQYWSIFFFL